jgi:two-component system NtrC family sensor kinase
MKQPPLPANEQDRLKALEQYQILDTDPESAFDDLTSLAAYI